MRFNELTQMEYAMVPAGSVFYRAKPDLALEEGAEISRMDQLERFTKQRLRAALLGRDDVNPHVTFVTAFDADGHEVFVAASDVVWVPG